MLNTKLNLYNAEWLDVVFDDRNKAYGAYDLRKHYAGNMVKAILIMITFIAAGWTVIKFTTKSVPADEVFKITPVEIPNVKIKPPVEEAKPDAPKPKPEPVKPQPQASTTRLAPPVVTSNPVTEEPPIIEDIKGAVAQTTVAGVKGVDNTAPKEPVTSGSGGTTAPSNDPVPFNALEVQPEPYGGMAAFGKFLGRTLRYPPIAAENGTAGRVLISFVVERDGSLTDITIVRDLGFGLGQEAVRVLKLAKAWKPGIQNGQPVRVRYTVPINFQLPE